MTKTAHLALAAAVVAASTLLLIPAALACSCAQPPPVPIAVERAAMVFEGTVTQGPVALPDGGVTYTFAAARAWKGEPGHEVTITTAAHSAACGRSYAKGSTWLLYPYRGDDGVLRDNICSRSMPMDSASADVAELGDGAPITVPPPADPPADAPPADGPAADPPADATDTTEEPQATAAPATEQEPPAEEPAADEPEDDLKKPGCSMATGAPAWGLLLVPLAALLRRRS